jgi:hypothetical protein
MYGCHNTERSHITSPIQNIITRLEEMNSTDICSVIDNRDEREMMWGMKHAVRGEHGVMPKVRSWDTVVTIEESAVLRLHQTLISE